MGWERRKRGGLYYTRTRRENGFRVREYFGNGELAELVAELDEGRRCERELLTQEARHELEGLRAEIAAAEEGTREFGEVALALAAGALVCAGHRRHNRGEWRRRNAERARERA
jgi:hypothetical protein